MKKQKVVSIVDGTEDEIINGYLDDGWLVKKMTTERVSITGEYSNTLKGKIVFLIEKSE